MDGAETSTVLGAKLNERFGDLITGIREQGEEVTIEIRADSVTEVCQVLRDAPDFAFEQLMDLCGVDYVHYGHADWKTSEAATTTGFSRGVGSGRYNDQTWGAERFAVVYQLLSVSRNERVRVRAMLAGDPPRVDSVAAIWNAADWYEREAFDLYGILFEGHPDLRRLLTDYGFVGHPFRKDFPLIGNVEMRYDPEKQRVVYEPVSIEERTLVPRVIRHDARYHAGTDASDDVDA